MVGQLVELGVGDVEGGRDVTGIVFAGGRPGVDDLHAFRLGQYGLFGNEVGVDQGVIPAGLGLLGRGIGRLDRGREVEWGGKKSGEQGRDCKDVVTQIAAVTSGAPAGAREIARVAVGLGDIRVRDTVLWDLMQPTADTSAAP